MYIDNTFHLEFIPTNYKKNGKWYLYLIPKAKGSQSIYGIRLGVYIKQTGTGATIYYLQGSRFKSFLKVSNFDVATDCVMLNYYYHLTGTK